MQGLDTINEGGTCCLICYKRTPLENGCTKSSDGYTGNGSHSATTESSTVNILSRFALHLHFDDKKSMKTEDLLLTDSTDTTVTVCMDCGRIMKKYCEYFNIMECLRLKLTWQLDQLKCVMKFANKVPSRVVCFKNSLLSQYANCDDMMERVVTFRKQIYSKCVKNTKRKKPIVKLTRWIDSKETKPELLDINTDECERQSEVKHPPDMEIQMSSCDTIDTFPDEQSNIGIAHGVLIKEDNMSEAGYTTEMTIPDMDPEVPLVNEIGWPSPSPTSNDIESNSLGSLQSDNANFPAYECDEAPSVGAVSKYEGLRTKFKCMKCMRTFSSKDKLSNHEASNTCVDSKTADGESAQLQKPPEKSNKQQNDENYEMNSEVSSETTSPENSDNEGVKMEKKVSASRNFKCTLENCGKTFIKKSLLELHTKLHGDFSCNFCSFKTDMADVLVDHEWNTHTNCNSRMVKCSRCPKVFKTRKGTGLNAKTIRHFCQKHLSIDYSTDKKCPICGQSFSNHRAERAIRRHIKEVHDTTGKDPNDIVYCDICKAPFSNDFQRSKHKKRVHNLSHLQCSICNHKSKTIRGLEGHLHNVHKVSVDAFRCTIPGCGKSFSQKFSFEVHTYRHKHKTEMLMCSICGKKFLDEWTLNSHTKSHTKSHSFKRKRKKAHSAVCHLCGKVVFGHYQSNAEEKLGLHLRTKMHSQDTAEGLSGIWKFTCQICGKLCQTSQKLEEHIRIHTKERPFCCKECGRNFSIKYNLKRHMRIVHKRTIPLERKKSALATEQDDEEKM